MAVARCAPLGDVREFGEASALDGPVGCDLWIVPPVLHADVAQMIGEDVHDGFQSLAHAGEHPLAFRVLAEVPFGNHVRSDLLDRHAAEHVF